MRVDVRTAVPRRDPLDAEVDFTITVPSGASVSVRSGSGDVTVTGVRGELRVEAVSGGITATSVGQVRLAADALGRRAARERRQQRHHRVHARRSR